MLIIPLDQCYIGAAKDLCDRSVGEGFYTEEDWRRILRSPGHFCNLLLEENGTLIGYNYNHLVTAGQAAEELKLSEKELRRAANAPEDAVYGICKSMGIEPEARRSGLGFELLQYGVEQLFQNGACSLWGSAWKQGDRIPMRGIFDRLGFHYLHDVKNVWYGIEGLKCPVCRQLHCVCDAALFYCVKEEWKHE